MENKKYSDWLKIDLHIHTDWSRKTKEDDYKGNFSVDTLKIKLKENEVEIFSLTDHNIININAYKEYYEKYNTAKDPLLLVGIELDLLVRTNNGDKTYHSLLIFNYSSYEKASEVNKKLEDKYKEKEIDNKNRILTIDEIIELFPEDDFFFIPHAGNTKSIVSGYRENIEDAQKMVLLMQSAFEKVKEKARQKYNEGFNKVLVEAFKNKNDIPYIEFSDNHNIDKYPCTHKGNNNKLHKFYYIKGSKNYETLRLAFIDPNSRIKSSNEYEQINHSLNYIEKLQISNDNFIEDNELTFSPHLNVIIGGRSSGKSLLLNLLGKKIDKIIVEDKYNIENEHVSIKSKRDANYQLTTSLSDELIYLNQGDIVRYFEEKKLYDLACESNKQEDYDSALSTFKEHKRNLEKIIDDFIASYSISYEINETRKFVLHNSTIENILNKNYILKFNNEKLSDDLDKSDIITELKNTVANIEENIKKLMEHDFLNISGDEKQIINNFEELIKNKALLLKKKGIVNNKIITFINCVKQLVDEKNQGLSTEARQKEEATRSLTQLKEDISNRFKKLVQLKYKCSELESFEYAKKEIIIINDDVSLVLEIEKEEEIKNIILDGINNSNKTKSLYVNILFLLNNKSNIKNYPTNDSENLNKKISRQFNYIFGKITFPKDYLKYIDGGSSKDNSPGYNSEKYLEIILKNSNNKLIFIDQPEDNLGNKFIANDLVLIIRNLKFQKQLFLVTHNPSVVVYGDAENIIIAENNNNNISYKQIVLENRQAQKEICGILDGGEYVFDNRSKKYNIKRILKEGHKNE